MNAAVFLFLAASFAAAGPAVESFQSVLTPSKTGVIAVEETIVFSENAALSREIPTRRLSWSGLRELSRVELKEALLNGEPVRLKTERSPRGLLWSLENPELGRKHSLFLRYETDRRSSKTSQGDGLIWDLTGFSWNIPVLSVEMGLRFPTDIASLEYALSLGKPGAMIETDRKKTNGHSFSWKSPRALQPKEGARLSLLLPKEYFSAAERPSLRRLEDNLHSIAACAGSAVLVLFFGAAGAFLWKPPRSLPPAPLDEEISIGSARFLLSGIYSHQVLEAGMRGLLVKGFLERLEKTDSGWTLRLNPRARDLLNSDEGALAEALQNGLNSDAGLRTAADAHAAALDGRWGSLLRSRAWGLWFSAAAFSSGLVGAMRAAAALPEKIPVSAMEALVWGAACAAGATLLAVILTTTYRAWRAAALAAQEGRSAAVPLLAAIALGFFSFGAVTAAAAGFQTAIGDVSPAALAAGFLLFFLTWSGYFLLRGPTPEGFAAREKAAEIEALGIGIEFDAPERFAQDMRRTANGGFL